MEDETLDTTSPASDPAPTGSTEPGFQLPPLGILAGLSERALADLTEYGRCDRVSAGAEIAQEGTMLDRFYVIVSGELAVSAHIGGKDVQLNIAGAGDCIGEINLLEPGPATASVKVHKDALLWSMDCEQLREFLYEETGAAGALLMGLAQCMSKRIRSANQLIAQHYVLPVETLPPGRERAITAENTPVQIGFFDRLRKAMTGTKKVRISTEIKM
jgi:CRP-like cAMP-binding protein